jgi:hypothetical protein
MSGALTVFEALFQPPSFDAAVVLAASTPPVPSNPLDPPLKAIAPRLTDDERAAWITAMGAPPPQIPCRPRRRHHRSNDHNNLHSCLSVPHEGRLQVASGSSVSDGSGHVVDDGIAGHRIVTQQVIDTFEQACREVRIAAPAAEAETTKVQE